ncbi:MAG TPA: tetratricopeptide repeat protein [Caulobacteraceae bacterium]|jgi:Flp pilus assembly protein TadD
MVIYSTGTFDIGQHLRRAGALIQQGQLESAWGTVHEVLNTDPQNVPAIQMRGLIYAQLGHMNEAVEDFRLAVRLAPNDAVAHNNLGNALRPLGLWEESLAACERALALAPDYPDAQLSHANALLDMGRPEEAVAGYDRLLQRTPRDPRALANRGLALRSLNRSQDAVKSFEQAMAVDPANDQIRANAGQAYMATGDLKTGFALFEARWATPIMAGYLQSRRFGRPQWLGQVPLQGRTLLLHSEQGWGDIFQFCRYAAIAAEQGARVLIEVLQPAVGLMRTLKGVSEVIEFGQPLPEFDFHCPVMSLPHAFGATLDTIPANVPYLSAEPAKVAGWSERLGPKTRPRVGLVWSSGVRPDQPELAAANGRRNLPFDRLKALAGLPVEFVSLQKGEPAEAEFVAFDQGAWDGPPIRNLASDLRDWADTAALIAALDLVVTVDTAIPHLAGAMGAPVWLMNRFDPCWRWLETRADSPWYPTMRLFRQPVLGDWDSVLAEVRAALERAFPA